MTKEIVANSGPSAADPTVPLSIPSSKEALWKENGGKTNDAVESLMVYAMSAMADPAGSASRIAVTTLSPVTLF